MRVLGIDCGSEYTGYGVVEETAERKLVCHVNGAIKLKSGTPMAAKLEKIFTDHHGHHRQAPAGDHGD